MSRETEPAAPQLWPNILPISAGNVILTLPCRSNFAECSWLARCAAADSACSGVCGLASGEAQAASATIVSTLRKRRFTGLLEYIDGGAGLPFSSGTNLPPPKRRPPPPLRERV